MQPKRYTLTAALPYANGPIHIGHLAGVYIPGDIYARYLRKCQKDVVYVCGSDEHGVPVTIRAKKEGITVQEVVDKYHNIIKKSLQDFGISFDIYSRTSNETHRKTSSEFFEKLDKEGKFIEKTTDQYYDSEANQFLADRLIKGACPKCSSEAYGDQCENCGCTLSPNELINPKSTLSGVELIKKATKHWFLPLDQYEGWLKEWILDGHKKDWKTNVYGQCKSWIEQGLQPRAVTRDLEWGVPVPVEGGEGKVLYVWFDAPIGYISATKDYFKEKGKENDWEKYWKSEDTQLVHFIGKDNIVFHCIIFPAMLKAHGDYILPENVPANEFLNLEGNKISTSRNWAVWLHEYLEAFPDKQDILRYVLTANAPETKDNDFTWADFQIRNNNELVANVGNFMNRVIVLTHKYFEGKVPPIYALDDIDKAFVDALATFPEKISNSIKRYRFKEALGFLMEFSSLGNKYLQDNEPWKLAKNFEENNEKICTIMHLALQLAANFAILSEPFLPMTAQKLQKALGLDGDLFWDQAGVIDLLKAGQEVQKMGLLFEKIEDKTVEEQVEKLLKTKQENEAENQSENKENNMEHSPIKDTIEFDDFMKLDIRVATIIAAEKLPKSSKLLKITLDTGVDKRVVLSGIGKHYKAEDIIGKQVSVLLNLAPKKMAGEVSNGMILMAEDAEGKLHFVNPPTNIDAGSGVS